MAEKELNQVDEKDVLHGFPRAPQTKIESIEVEKTAQVKPKPENVEAEKTAPVKSKPEKVEAEKTPQVKPKPANTEVKKTDSKPKAVEGDKKTPEKPKEGKKGAKAKKKVPFTAKSFENKLRSVVSLGYREDAAIIKKEEKVVPSTALDNGYFQISQLEKYSKFVDNMDGFVEKYRQLLEYIKVNDASDKQLGVLCSRVDILLDVFMNYDKVLLSGIEEEEKDKIKQEIEDLVSELNELCTDIYQNTSELGIMEVVGNIKMLKSLLKSDRKLDEVDEEKEDVTKM